MNQFLYVQKGPSLYTECYHWPWTLLAPFKKRDILALLRYYQNVLDMIFGTDSLETRQIYIDFWRTQFENYRAYPTLFTKEPLRTAIQKHRLPIELFETFLVVIPIVKDETQQLLTTLLPKFSEVVCEKYPKFVVEFV